MPNKTIITILLGLLIPIPAFAQDVNTQLIKAAQDGQTEEVRSLLEAGVNVDAKDENGMTPLMWAAFGGSAKTVKVLLDAGADMSVKDKQGTTAQMWASGNEIVLLLKTSERLTVTLDGIHVELPGSFQERPELAVANQLYAPGRFQFGEGRAFYDPSSAAIIQIHSSDNPLIGMNHEKAHKKFLQDFGKDPKAGAQPIVWRSFLTADTTKSLAQSLPEGMGPLSKRSWGLDTFASMFFPIPKEVDEAHGKKAAEWMILAKNDKEKLIREISQFVRPDGKIVFPLFFQTNNPAGIYISSLTPGSLLQIQGPVDLWDVDFVPSQALLGELSMFTYGGIKRLAQAFRARTSAQVQDEAKLLSLPDDVVGKFPYFWWIMVSAKDSVFQPGAKPLYHIVMATFDDGDPPELLHSVIKSIKFDIDERAITHLEFPELYLLLEVESDKEIFDSARSLRAEDIDLLKQATKSGSAMAELLLGLAYSYEFGVKEDYKEAAKRYRKAAEKGLALAQSRLGIMYRDAIGVSQDHSDAVKWFRKAAEQGHPEAQETLGSLYALGRGVPQNDEEVARWFRKAAEQGLARAQAYLGQLYTAGRGVTQSYEEAVKWLRPAAEQGNVTAQNSLGWLYATAKDPKFQDPKKAIEYAKKAVEGSQGKEPAYLDTLAEAYYSNRKYDKAIQTIKKAITLKPDWDYAKEQLKKFEQAKQSKGRR
ncbi:ankyrin repeat domain-containing protein [Acidobacteria bacterium AH-259-O06]|nr:ankyrin repeat domain-containing protein [Acidobacteria bacterium AH-259-O06]